MSRALTLPQRRAVVRISGLVLLNAMIFQDVLAQRDVRVKPLQSFREQATVVATLGEHWQFIIDKINYYPIFHLSRQLLGSLAADPDVNAAVAELIDAALRIVGWRAALRHDLAGRVYHRLLAEAKYLGAYYTAIPSAVLLLKLALRSGWESVDWSDLGAVSEFRVADLACGTGTLLMAAADSVTDNYIAACQLGSKAPDLDELHRALVGDVIHGCDVLQSAIHLTASTLALRAPHVTIDLTNLSCHKLGGESDVLGSMEFIYGPTIGGTLFAQPQVVAGKPSDSATGVTLPKLDLCVMNPPFTRSVGGNLLFGHLPADERPRLQSKLRKAVKENGLQANITAGLGAVFVALADRYIKPGGRIALVLPRALLSGVAWRPSRDLISRGYDLEYVISSVMSSK